MAASNLRHQQRGCFRSFPPHSITWLQQSRRHGRPLHIQSYAWSQCRKLGKQYELDQVCGKTKNGPKKGKTSLFRSVPMSLPPVTNASAVSTPKKPSCQISLAGVNLSLLAVLLDLLAQCLPLHIQQIHNLLTSLTKSLSATLPNINHSLHHRLQLIRQPGDNRTTSSGSRMARLLQDILTSEAPMSPAEVANLI